MADDDPDKAGNTDGDGQGDGTDQPAAEQAADDFMADENSDVGVVPFLKDVLGAFISTLILMVFGVNFVIFR